MVIPTAVLIGLWVGGFVAAVFCVAMIATWIRGHIVIRRVRRVIFDAAATDQESANLARRVLRSERRVGKAQILAVGSTAVALLGAAGTVILTNVFATASSAVTASPGGAAFQQQLVIVVALQASAVLSTSLFAGALLVGPWWLLRMHVQLQVSVAEQQSAQHTPIGSDHVARSTARRDGRSDALTLRSWIRI